MTVDELKNHYRAKDDADLARKIGYTKGAISKWRNNGIPFPTQAIFQVITNSELKVSLELLKEHLEMLAA